MTDAGQTMAGLARPMQHAVNNLVMVLQANMDSVLAGLPPEDRAAIRLGRAAQAAKELEALMRAFLRLGRPEESAPLDSGRFLASALPALALAVGKPVKVETVSTTPVVPQRPLMDLALLGAFAGAKALPLSTRPTVFLEGASWRLNWALPEGSRAELEGVSIGVEESGEETRLTFPPASA